jgi:parvulin-like peptidyl-prolyl isomerase
MEERGRARGLLGVGAALGIALAAVGLVRGGTLPDAALASGEVARVNGVPIRSDELERLLGALDADKRNPVAEGDRARVLARLVDEELLVQRALEIGLADSEPGVRKALVQALVDSVVAEAESEEPDASELRRFYEENREYFGAGERIRVERLVFRASSRPGDPAERARQARQALVEGRPLEAVAAELADEPLVPVPASALPAAKLREYLGDDLARQALAAPEGAWSEPRESAEGVQLLRVAERQRAESAPFDAVAHQVAAEWRRRQGDRALREYLDFLRAQAEIRWAAGAPR